MGRGAADAARKEEPWSCYMCQPQKRYGLLLRRHDWTTRLKEFFTNEKGQEYVSELGRSSAPASGSGRRRRRVLQDTGMDGLIFSPSALPNLCSWSFETRMGCFWAVVEELHLQKQQSEKEDFPSLKQP